MKLGLQGRYALAILPLIVLLVGLFAATLLYQTERQADDMRRSGVNVLGNSLFQRMEANGRTLAPLLAESLVNAVYLMDLGDIGDAIGPTRKRGDIEYIYVFDASGHVLHDGTDDNAAFGRLLDDFHLRMALDSAEPVVWIDDSLNVATAIRLGPDVLGGVSVGLSLKPIHRDFTTLRDKWDHIHQEHVEDYFIWSVAAALALLVVGTLVTFLLARNLSRPIATLANLTSRIGKGRYDIDIPIERSDEIGTLAESLRKMVDDLKHTTVSKVYVDNILATTLDALIVVAPDGTIRTVNPAACKLLGYGAEELIGQPVVNITARESIGNRPSADSDVIEPIPVGDVESALLSKDGREIPVLISAARMRNAEGELDGIVYAARDITERKRAEEALRESDERFRAVFDNIPVCLNLKDTEGRYLLVNKPYEEWLGHPAEEIIGKTAGEFLEDATEVENLTAAERTVLETGEGLEREVKVARPDGVYDRILIKFPIRSADGSFSGIGTAAVDITERKRAEEALAEKSALLETTFENMSQGIRVLDADLRLVACNRQFIELHEYPPDFIRLGMPLEDFVRFRVERGDRGPVDVEEYVRKRVEAKRRPVAYHRENDLPNGRTALAYHEPMPNGGWVSTYTDVTERRKARAEIAEKSALLETTFEAMSQAIAVFDADLRLVAYNQRYIDLRGYPKDYISLGKPYEEILRFNAERGEYGPGDCEKQVKDRLEAARQRKRWRTEYTKADGTALAVGFDPIPGGGFVATFIDMTERKKAEREIAEKSAHLEMTFENMLQGIAVFDADLKLAAFNQRYVDLRDYPPGFIRLGVKFEDIARFRAERGDYGPVDVEKQVRKLVRAARQGKAARNERTTLHGKVLALRRSPLPDGGFITTSTDITERKQAEREIAEKSALLETTLESMSQGITVYDADHRLIAFNRRFAELFDFPPEYLRPGRTFEDLARFLAERGEYGPGNVEEQVRKRVAAKDLGGIKPRERTRPNGTIISARRDPMPGGGYVTTYTDITERKRAEEALRQSEELFSKVFHASPGMFVISRPEGGAHHEVSENWIATLGYSRDEAMAKTSVELGIWADTRDRTRFFERLKKEGSVRDFEAKFRTKSGEELDVLVAGEYLEFGGEPHVIVVSHDITARKRADEALRAREARLHELQTELLNVSRQSAMGELSSALAHELNQPLAAIMNYVQACRRMIKKSGGAVSEKAFQMMDNALDQADRAGAIMRGLRDIVERGETVRRESEINKVVEEASALGLIGAARNGVTVDLDFAADMPTVIINEIQIQQVVMNLVRNGVEAMAESKKRDLAIKTALDGKDRVEISISDSGPGLTEEVERRLFQPFVSTKAGGMGIGLSISHSIIEAHGGRLWATANRDGGTVFHFTLPIAEYEAKLVAE